MMITFAVIALALIGLLAWATKPPRLATRPTQDIFEFLSQPRHCLRLPFILQVMQPEDTEFLRESGNVELMHTLRGQRRRVALRYLDQLQEEFEMLLEISRTLAVMAPEVIAVEEMERWRLSLLFAWNCTILRWRLRMGMQPVVGFTTISSMATRMVRHLEAATTRIAEGAIHAGGRVHLSLDDGEER